MCECLIFVCLFSRPDGDAAVGEEHGRLGQGVRVTDCEANAPHAPRLMRFRISSPTGAATSSRISSASPRSACPWRRTGCPNASCTSGRTGSRCWTGSIGPAPAPSSASTPSASRWPTDPRPSEPHLLCSGQARLAVLARVHSWDLYSLDIRLPLLRFPRDASPYTHCQPLWGGPASGH